MEDKELSVKLKKDRAAAAVLSRDYELATQLYTQLLSSDPENKELLFALGNLYERSGNNREAIPVYKKIVALDGQNVNALNSLGSIYRRLGKYNESIAVLEQAVIADEKDMQSFYNLGFTYRSMEKYDYAIKSFKIVIESKPDDVLAYNHLGAIYAIKNEQKKAISTFLMGLTIDPNHPVLHLNLAKSYEAIGNVQKAKQEYEATLRSNPGWLEAIDSYADLLISTGELKNASDLVTKSLNLHSDDSGLHTKMGQVYYFQEEFSSAETEFTEAVKFDSKNKKAFSFLAESYEKNGKLEQALQTMQQYEEAYPSDSEMLRQYASILLSNGKFNSASRKIKELYDKEPDSIQTLSLLSQYFICRGNDEKLSKCLSKIQKKSPNDLKYKLDMAKRYEQMEAYSKAETQLKEYLLSNPNDRDAEAFLASIYEKEGRLENALSLYQKLSADSENELKDSPVLTEEENVAGETLSSDSEPDTENPENAIPELPAEDEGEIVTEKTEELSELEAIEPRSDADLINNLIDSAREESEFNVNDIFDDTQNTKQINSFVPEEDLSLENSEKIDNSDEKVEQKTDSFAFSGSLILDAEKMLEKNEKSISPVQVAFEKSIPLATNVFYVKQEMPKLNTASEKFAKEKELFCKLKELAEFLPPEKKEEFHKSKYYMLLDYLIARFSLKKGLLSVANEFAHLDKSNKMLENASILSLTKETFSSMQDYIKSLNDPYTATALLKENTDLLAKMPTLEK